MKRKNGIKYGVQFKRSVVEELGEWSKWSSDLRVHAKKSGVTVATLRRWVKEYGNPTQQKMIGAQNDVALERPQSANDNDMALVRMEDVEERLVELARGFEVLCKRIEGVRSAIEKNK